MRGRPSAAPVSPALSWWATPRGAGVIVALAAVAAFARALGNGFTYDEGLVLVGAQRFLQSGAFGALLGKSYFGASLEGTWRPFCTLTYMLDAMVWFHPAMFKATSLLWHVAAALLLMAFTRRLLPEARRPWAIVAGLVFVLHPITAETVDNASFREDSLVTVFTLATLILALDRRPALAAVAYALGLLSKESAVMAPALLALLRLGRFDRQIPRTFGAPEPAAPPGPGARLGRTIVELIPYGMVTIIYLAIRFGPLRTPVAYARYPGGTFGDTLMGLPVIWGHYLRLLVWPWPLCADYTGYFQFGPQPRGPVLLGSLFIVLYLAGAALALRRGERVAALGLVWFLLTLLPVSNLLPIPIPAAERFLYLPLCGIAIAAAVTVARYAERHPAPAARRRAGVFGVAVLAALAVVLNRRHGDWRDDQTLWQATVAVNPRSCGAQSAVGGNLLSRGMKTGDPETLRASAAREELALRLCSDESDPFRAAFTYTRLGAARALLDDRAGARAALERAAALHPRYALPFAWLGYLAYQEGDPAASAMLLKKAIIDLGPPDATVAAVAQIYVDKI